MFNRLKFVATSTLAYLGDAAHRRFVATVIAMIAAHFLGRALDADSVANLLEIAIGGLGGAWSSRTPEVTS